MQALLQNPMDTLRRMGPYVLIELLLPGGTLLALLLWLFSGMSRGQLADVQQPVRSPMTVERQVCVCGRCEASC